MAVFGPLFSKKETKEKTGDEEVPSPKKEKSRLGLLLSPKSKKPKRKTARLSKKVEFLDPQNEVDLEDKIEKLEDALESAAEEAEQNLGNSKLSFFILTAKSSF